MKFRHLVCALALLPVTAPAAEKASPAEDTIKPLVHIDDFTLTNLHFSIFLATREVAAETPGQQIRLLNELVNTFMVAHSDQGRALAANPEIKAAMEIENARLLARNVINNAIEQIKISDAEIEKAYQQNYADSGGREYKARHILLETPEEAAAVIEALKAGSSFEQLAREKSTGPSGPDGGNLGWFTPDSMVKPFADALVALEDGEYSPSPVQTRFGWHVILREATREVPTPELEQVREELINDLKTAKLSAFIRDMRDKANIEVIQTDSDAAE